MNIKNRTIYCKDNLEILKGIDTGTVDMIYLDPPFNSKKAWNAPIGSSAEGASFKDTWSDDDIKSEWVDAIRAEHPALHAFLNGMKMWSVESDVAYITYMAIRIIECHRVLKDTGSLFYHCDHVMNDYVKVMLDIIFGRNRDVNNLVWCYTGGGLPKKGFPRKHDNIFFYSKTEDFKFNTLYQPFAKSTLDRFNKVDKDGRRYKVTKTVDGKEHITYMNNKGKAMPDYWSITALNSSYNESTGYPTQKPLELLRNIIECSTDQGDVVLDPFCGCATTCIAAEQLGREWVGIDVSIKAYELVKLRLKKDVPPDLLRGEPHFSTVAPIRNGGEEKEMKEVYIISNSAYTDEFKVGIATNTNSRLNSYQTSDPNRGYELKYKVKTPKFREIEKAVHDHFDNRHEWVRAELNDIIDFIKSKL